MHIQKTCAYCYVTSSGLSSHSVSPGDVIQLSMPDWLVKSELACVSHSQICWYHHLCFIFFQVHDHVTLVSFVKPIVGGHVENTALFKADTSNSLSVIIQPHVCSDSHQKVSLPFICFWDVLEKVKIFQWQIRRNDAIWVQPFRKDYSVKVIIMIRIHNWAQ